MFDSNVDGNLRKQILERKVSLLMTDSERARLYNLPKGCKIRENAKHVTIPGDVTVLLPLLYASL